MDRLIDKIYYICGYTGRCHECKYRNLVIYKCKNNNCHLVYCLDCYQDVMLLDCCKNCVIWEWHD